MIANIWTGALPVGYINLPMALWQVLVTPTKTVEEDQASDSFSQLFRECFGMRCAQFDRRFKKLVLVYKLFS